MWHGLVEAPSSQSVAPGKEPAKARTLFQDEVERLIPIELRRNRPNAGIGQLPADRVVPQVKQEEKAPHLVDISPQRDFSLCKEVLVEAPVGAEEVMPGAEVRAKITAALADQTVRVEDRILHGPKEHRWPAASGARCAIVELLVCSMKVGETSMAKSSDKPLIADAGLCCDSEALGEVEFVVSLEAVSGCSLESGGDIIQWATEQKASASSCLQLGHIQLALLTYSAIARKLSEANCETGNPVDRKIASLRLASRLNCGLCFLRLGLWQKVLDACTEVLGEDAQNVKALFRRGKALLQLGRLTEAAADFAQANKLDPENREVSQQLKHCHGLRKKAADKATVLDEQRSKRADKWG